MISSFLSSSTTTTTGTNTAHHGGNHSNTSSTLRKMIDAAAIGKHHVKWSHVLHYLKAQCIVKEEMNDEESDDDEHDNNDDRKRTKKSTSDNNQQYPFEIPFQRYYVASPDLLAELSPTTTTTTTTTNNNNNNSSGQRPSILQTTIGYYYGGSSSTTSTTDRDDDNNHHHSNSKIVVAVPPPLSIIQALCYLGPNAISHVEPMTGRMLLHTIIYQFQQSSSREQQQDRRRHSSSSTPLESMMELLIAAYPTALLHRDNHGCTPLHYLFLYQAPFCTIQMCHLCLYNFQHNKHLFFTLRQPIHTSNTTTLSSSSIKQGTNSNNQKNEFPPLPDIPRPTQHNKIPCTAAIIPDSIHGCIPLHYAVLYGASLEILQLLIAAYPASKHVVDRYHRTPIHYLLGANLLFVNHNTSDTTNTTHLDRDSCDDYHVPTAITGEPLPSWNYEKTSTQPVTLLQQQKMISNHYYYYDPPPSRRQHSSTMNTRTSSNSIVPIVQLLLTSRVSRTVDAIFQRCPLHCAAIYIAHQTFLVHPNNDTTSTGSSRTEYPNDNCDDVDDTTTSRNNELLAVLQLFIDSYAKQCSCQDKYGMTPIVLLLYTVQQLQYRIYMEQCANDDDATTNDDDDVSLLLLRSTARRRRQLSCGYTLSLRIIQLFIQAKRPSVMNTTNTLTMTVSTTGIGDDGNKTTMPIDDTTASRVVAIEDHDGRLPIHIALQIAISSEIVDLLVTSYPTCLVHTTTNDTWCPLHAAFTCHYTTHLQSIETARILLFQSYQAGRYGTTVDGRLAMKMEDAHGYYPIHYACQNNASSAVVSLFVERYSHCCYQQTHTDDLPIHCIVQNLHPVVVRHILLDIVRANKSDSSIHQEQDTTNTEYIIQELLIEVRAKLTALLRPLILCKEHETTAKDKLSIADSITGMLPLHIAIVFQIFDYPMLLKMLQLYPYSAMQYTNNLQMLLQRQEPQNSRRNVQIQQGQESEATEVISVPVPNVHRYSAIDLHDLCHDQLRHADSRATTVPSAQPQRHNAQDHVVYNDIEWYRIRELLFSFGPTLESHRHRQDLLDHGVQIIVDELLHHEQQQQEQHNDDVGAINISAGDQEDNQTTDSTSTGTMVPPGYHYTASNTIQSFLPNLKVTHSVSIMEEEIGIRPQRFRRRRRGKVSKRLQSNKSRYHQQPQQSSSSFAAASSESHVVNNSNTITNGPTSGSDTLTSVDFGSKVVQLDVQLKTNSSIYDDDDVRFIRDHDDDNDSFFSGEDGDSAANDDDSYISDEEDDDDETGTDEYDTQDSDTKGSFSHETMSQSRLRTTFEEGEEDDDSEVNTESDDFTSRRGTFDDDDESAMRTVTTAGGTVSRRVTFDEESTGRSSPQKSTAMNNIVSSVGSFFDLPRENPTLGEEKKDEVDDLELASTPRAANRRKNAVAYQRPPYMSEVGLRIWTFFVMYCDVNNPKDNYADKLAEIVAVVKYSTWEELVSCPLPPYAKNYSKKGMEIDGLSFRDIASPKCRALIHKTSYFLGKYDFRSDRDILVYRTSRDDSVVVEANEWLYTTESTTNAKNPGISEERIWTTGEVPAEIGVTFETHKRAVWIKFTKNTHEYENEIDCRVQLGISVDDETVKGTGNDVIPILQHFNAISTERKSDKSYGIQRRDERFKSLKLISGCTSERKVQLLLHEYPYVIVYPAPLRRTLNDYYLKNGVSQTSECKQILRQLTHALGFLHENDVCHGNICMRNIVSLDSNAQDGLLWGFLNMSCAKFLRKTNRQYLGGIDSNGFAHFETETLPPEMFMKVTTNDLKQYLAYWAVVEKRFNVTIDRKLINPVVDMSSGSTYVVKCYFIPLSLGENDVQLPYQLVPTNTSSDFWALGQLLFVLHTGRNLFQVSARDGRLFDYGGKCNWDGCSLVHEHVDDASVKDVLLLCLSLNETRNGLTANDLLHRPFFTGEDVPHKLSEVLQLESAAHKRATMKKLHDESEKKWLDDRSTTISCWDFELLERFHHSPTEIVKNLLTRKLEVASPCSVILLPYDPFNATKGEDNADIAEQMGIELLELSKVCHVCAAIKRLVNENKGNNKNGFSLVELAQEKVFPSSSFNSIQSNMSELAARYVEEFRRNPLAVAMKLITRQIEQVYKCFEGRSMYLFLIDEYSLEPTFCSTNRIPVSANQRIDFFTNVLPLTHLYLQYARGVTKGLLGMSKLLFSSSKNDTPHSWKIAEAGLSNSFSMSSWTDEMLVLMGTRTASPSPLCSISANISLVRDYLFEVDPQRDVGGLKRVIAANTCLWTNQADATTLEDSARSRTFSDALHATTI